MGKQKWATPQKKARLRKELAARDGWICHYCGANLVPDGEWKVYCRKTIFGGWTPVEGYFMPQLDHIHPQSRGGINDISNLVLSCGHCNTSKGTKTEEEYRSKQ